MAAEDVLKAWQNPALMATKTSLLILYSEYIQESREILYYASWFVLVIVNLAGVILTLINIFQCRPIAASFNNIAGQAKCIGLLTQFICSAPVNIITNLAILASTYPSPHRLKIATREKFILVFIFGLGVFVTVIDVLRIYYLQQAIDDISISSGPNSTFGARTSPGMPHLPSCGQRSR